MKFHRTDMPPRGAFDPLRNTRLYGGRDDQIAGAALASRGQPNPNYAPARKSRTELIAQREGQAHRAHLQAAQDRMLAAQDRVRMAKRLGRDYAALAQEARAARAAYIALNGGLESRTVEVNLGSDANKIKAV